MIIAFYPGAGGNRYLRMTQDLEWQLHGRSYDNTVGHQSAEHRFIYPNTDHHTTSDVILTHCVNTELIKSTWPDHPITVIIADLQCCLRREWMLHGHERYCDKVDPTKIDKIDLYNAIKAAAWPSISNAQDIELLSDHIRQEFDVAYSKMIDSVTAPATDVCGIIKQEYSQQIDSACSQIQWHKDYYETYPMDLSFCNTLIDLKDIHVFSHYMNQELSLYPSEVFDRCWTVIYDR